MSVTPQQNLPSAKLTEAEEHLYGNPIQLPGDDELLHILMTGYRESTSLQHMIGNDNYMLRYVKACQSMCQGGMHFQRTLSILRDTRAELKKKEEELKKLQKKLDEVIADRTKWVS